VLAVVLRVVSGNALILLHISILLLSGGSVQELLDVGVVPAQLFTGQAIYLREHKHGGLDVFSRCAVRRPSVLIDRLLGELHAEVAAADSDVSTAARGVADNGVVLVEHHTKVTLGLPHHTHRASY
jgi:hypothetical protein